MISGNIPLGSSKDMMQPSVKPKINLERQLMRRQGNYESIKSYILDLNGLFNEYDQTFDAENFRKFFEIGGFIEQDSKYYQYDTSVMIATTAMEYQQRISSRDVLFQFFTPCL
ncbi:hypothetical protein JTB14_004441 [Gonioctena quinquepunctata]|nr:hypothetical protein JTB14_004441 [Gonioctena quinquepunctata]